MNDGGTLRARGLKPLLAAEIVSGLGSQMTALALPWFVLVTTGSPTRMGLVLAAELLPVAVLGIPSGSVIARYGARRTMIACDLGRAPFVASVPLLHELGVLSFPLLLGIVGAIGCLSAPFYASQRLILPELLGEDERVIAQANTVVEGAQRTTALVGPAASGVLIASMGATNVLYLDAATFLVSVVILATLVPKRVPAPVGEEERGLLTGLRFLLKDDVLGAFTVALVLFGLLSSVLFAAIPVLAYERYDGDARVAGWLFAAFGAGALLGNVFAFRMFGRVDPLRVAAVAVIVGALPLWILPLDLPAIVPVAALFLSSLTWPIGNAAVIGLFTLRPPAALRAKVMTAAFTLNTIAGPLGFVAAGPLLEGLGVSPVLLALAALWAATSVLAAIVAVTAASRVKPVPP